jgi:hypothetical protein
VPGVLRSQAFMGSVGMGVGRSWKTGLCVINSETGLCVINSSYMSGVGG